MENATITKDSDVRISIFQNTARLKNRIEKGVERDSLLPAMIPTKFASRRLVGFIRFTNVPFKLRLKTKKRTNRVAPKKESELSILELALVQPFFGLLYLGWESNPHSVARTGF